MGCSLGPDGKMETDQIILTEQVSILHPSLLVSTILRETERQTETDRKRQRQRWREWETDRERGMERDPSVREQSFVGWDTPAGGEDLGSEHVCSSRGRVLSIFISAPSPVLPEISRLWTDRQASLSLGQE